MLRIHQVSNHRSQSPAPVLRAPPHGFLQRKCACGGNAGFDDDCEDCQKKRLQRKLWARHDLEKWVTKLSLEEMFSARDQSNI